MTALLDALARAFVAPAKGERLEPAVLGRAGSAAVCGPAAEPLACALALLLRRGGPVVVCVWGAAAHRAHVPPTAGARRLAASMTTRGLTARATGRLVLVSLDGEVPVAVAQAGRASAAAGAVPAVLALCAPRDGAFDELLSMQDVAVLAADRAPEALVRLGVTSLADVCAAAVAAPALTGAGAWAARAGLGVGPVARRALAAALDAVPAEARVR